MSRTPAQFGMKLARLQQEVTTIPPHAVDRAALMVTTSVRRELASALPSGRLRNVGKRGAKVSVGYNVKGTRNPTALVRMRGPAQLVERDTRPHAIAPRRRGARALRNAGARGERSTNRRALAIPGVGMRPSVRHPGTRGKHPWARGVMRVQHEILPTIARESGLGRAVGRAFR